MTLAADVIRVRISDEAGTQFVCTLSEFIESNADAIEAADITPEEILAIAAGTRVTFGGGAAPVFHVEAVEA